MLDKPQKTFLIVTGSAIGAATLAGAMDAIPAVRIDFAIFGALLSVAFLKRERLMRLLPANSPSSSDPGLLRFIAGTGACLAVFLAFVLLVRSEQSPEEYARSQAQYAAQRQAADAEQAAQRHREFVDDVNKAMQPGIDRSWRAINGQETAGDRRRDAIEDEADHIHRVQEALDAYKR